MAITQISRITHRHGLRENLPQLATAELGWCLDTKQLFIGNGTIEEGAPNLGNTEILTEFSDVFTLRGTYTYKGERGTYIVQTGHTSLSPIARSLGDKLDDYVSVRDFGAVGDGITDDTLAINRAIANLHRSNLVGTQPLVRRTLFFPAGKYIVSSVINLLPFVKLEGEGRNATEIVQTALTAHSVVRNVDAFGQFGADNGLNGATPSRFNEISGMTLVHQHERDIFKVDSLNSVLFRRVGFIGSRTLPLDAGLGTAGIRVNSTAFTSKNIIIDECVFANLAYGVLIEDNTSTVAINKSQLTELYQGIVANNGYHISITQNYFDKISTHGILGQGASTNIVSSHNYFADVGNTMTGLHPATPAIEFRNSNCYSIADGFARTDVAERDVESVRINKKQSALLGKNATFTLGTKTQYAGVEVTLSDNVSTLTQIETPNVKQNAVIHYTIVRGVATRIGTLTVNKIGSDIQYVDEYTESSSVGVALTPTEHNGNIIINYTSTSLGVAPIFNYSLRTLD